MAFVLLVVTTAAGVLWARQHPEGELPLWAIAFPSGFLGSATLARFTHGSRFQTVWGVPWFCLCPGLVSLTRLHLPSGRFQLALLAGVALGNLASNLYARAGSPPALPPSPPTT